MPRPNTLRDRETKQVEFVKAPRVPSKTLYVYDGALNVSPVHNARFDENYGTQSSKKVRVTRQFVNSRENGLGIPLPAGRVRFYRREGESGALQFTGENVIDHTPQGETVRVYVDDAFDLVGERKRLFFKVDTEGKTSSESIEVTLRNRRKVPIEVRVVEHLYRWIEWEIVEASASHEIVDARSIEFRVTVAPNEEKKISYTAQYNW